MLNLILYLGVLYFLVSLVLDIFFVYVPVARIEQQIDDAINKIDGIADKVETTDQKVDNLLDRFRPEIADILNDVEAIINNFCKTTLGGQFCKGIN